jgi:hypothetical protein
MQLLVQTYYDERIYLYGLSITKVFDNIRRDLLIPILQETGIYEKDIRIIYKLYWNQIAKLKLNHTSQNSNIRIAKKVRQGCIFSLPLFNIYVKKIFQLGT